MPHDRDFAIIVGVSRYPGLSDLQGSENDACRFFEWVTDPSGGGVLCSTARPQVPAPPACPMPVMGQCGRASLAAGVNHARLILSTHYNGAPAPASEPTQHALEQALLEIDALSQQRMAAGLDKKVGRRLYLYFSGHGCAPVDHESALLAANATRAWPGYHVPGRAWADLFYYGGYFEEVVLFMDCCRERLPRVPLREPPLPRFVQSTQIDKANRLYGFATRWTRLAKEAPFGGTGGTVHGVFTYALLEGLRGKAADVQSGRVTAQSLANWLYANMQLYLTPEQRSDDEVPKEPEIDCDPVKGSGLVLADVGRRMFRVSLSVSPERLGKPISIKDGTFRTVRDTPAAPNPWEFELPAGLYELRSEAYEQAFEVTGKGDEHVQC